MSTETRLQELLAVGVVFKGYVSPSDAIPLAAAHIAESGELWICPLWPKSNPATKCYAFSNIEDGGRYFAFKNAENQPVCSIAPLNSDQREAAQWDKWIGQDAAAEEGRDFAKSPEARIGAI